MKQRLQKLLANAGVASRRKVEDMIREGRVSVNGKIMIDLPILVEGHDRVEVDGERVMLNHHGKSERIYIALNKPRDVLSTTAAQGEQRLAIDLLPPDLPARVYPVGRLDAQSRGLLLFTNDGELTNQLTHPRFGVPKIYRANVDGDVTVETLTRLQKSISRGGKSEIKVIKRNGKTTVLQIMILEGRNPELRPIFAHIGHKLRDLTRVAIGPLELGRMEPGEFRLLTPREVRELRRATRPARKFGNKSKP